MRICNNHEELFRDPVGKWLPFGSGLVWCHSATLTGVVMWGRPGRSDAEALVRALDGHACLAPGFDFVQDGRAIESVDPAALDVMLTWLRDHRQVLRDNVRRRVGLIPRGLPGLTLAGIQVALGLENQIAIVDDAPSAFRMLLPESGDAVCAEIEQVIEQAREMAGLLVSLRALLAATHGSLDLASAARSLGVSTRSLQRELAQAGVSFRTEQADARFRSCEEMLRGDEKLSTIAMQLGLRRESTLAELTRARTGLTPGELRRRLRSA